MRILYISAVIPAASGSGGKRACYNHLVDLQKNATNIHAVFVSVDGTQPDQNIFDPEKTTWKSFQRETPRIGESSKAKFAALFDLVFGDWPRQVKAAYSLAANDYIADYVLHHPVDLIVVEHISGFALLKKLTKNIPVVYISYNIEANILLDQLSYSPLLSLYRVAFLLDHLKMKSFEKKIIQEVSGIVCISSIDVDDTVRLAGGTKNKVVHWQELNNLKSELWKYTGAKKLLFVGSASYFPNREAIEWLVNILMPEIFKIDPQVNLYLCGSSSSDVDMPLVSPNVNFLGFVSDSVLEECHRESDLFISPIRLGGGIKMKVLDVLSYGMPVVASQESMRGIEFIHPFPAIDFDDVHATALMIVNLLDSEDYLNEISNLIVEQLSNEMVNRSKLINVVKKLALSRNDN